MSTPCTYICSLNLACGFFLSLCHFLSSMMMGRAHNHEQLNLYGQRGIWLQPLVCRNMNNLKQNLQKHQWTGIADITADLQIVLKSKCWSVIMAEYCCSATGSFSFPHFISGTWSKDLLLGLHIDCNNDGAGLLMSVWSTLCRSEDVILPVRCSCHV